MNIIRRGKGAPGAAGFIAGIFLFTMSLSGAARAVTVYDKDDFRITLSGHFQNLAQSYDDPFSDQLDDYGIPSRWAGHVSNDTARTRLTFRFLTGGMVSAETSLDATYTFGSVLDSFAFDLTKDLAPPTYFNWQYAYGDPEDGRYGTLSVYRAMVTIEAEKFRIVLGRQRLAYGTALFWSPIDVWNPVSPLSLEPEEKIGVDGVSALWWIGDDLTLTALAAAADDWETARVAGSASVKHESYTFDFLAGKREEDYVYGFDFVGYVGDAGLRGEVTYTSTRERESLAAGLPYLDPATARTVNNDSLQYARAVIGMDYAWANSLYAAAEYYHNGGPLETDQALFLSDFVLAPGKTIAGYYGSSGVDTANRNFVGGMVSYDLDPLVKGTLFGIHDIDGGSWVIAPSLLWSASDYLTVSLGGQIFGGSENGEYGLSPDLAWLKARIDF